MLPCLALLTFRCRNGLSVYVMTVSCYPIPVLFPEPPWWVVRRGIALTHPLTSENPRPDSGHIRSNDASNVTFSYFLRLVWVPVSRFAISNERGKEGGEGFLRFIDRLGKFLGPVQASKKKKFGFQGFRPCARWGRRDARLVRAK
jgi:hypothetical protein